jgi:hypothetical protein
MDVDYATLVDKSGGWPMYCNGPDAANAIACPGTPYGCGDCTCAFWGHAIQAWSLYNSGRQAYVTPESIVSMYSNISGFDPQTGANDFGCNMQTVLEYMRTTGLPDVKGHVHKIVGYALLRNNSQELLAQALDLGGTVYLGGSIQQAQEDQFSQGLPWDYVAGSPVVGGHAFGLQRRAPVGLSKLRITTWGTLWHATTPFYANQVDEAYYVVSQDDLNAHGTDRAGFNLAALLADMSKIS